MWLAALTTAALSSCGTDVAASGTGDAAAGSSSGASTGPATTSPELRPEDAVLTVVLGDETTDPGPDGWPELLAASLDPHVAPMTVTAATGDAGAGFSTAPTFDVSVPEHVTGSSQLVVLFDGRMTDADPAALVDGVHRTLVATERAASDARVVVVGPLPGAGTDPGEATRATLASAVEAAGGSFIDPVADAWPAQPTQRDIAELIAPHVRDLVAALAASGANR